MNYDALNIAQYIIDYCNKNNLSVNNLKLQTLLYFVWIHYYKQTGKILFDDNFSARQLGPAVSEVYYEYCPWGGIHIFRRYEVPLLLEDKTTIDECLAKEALFPLCSLSEKSRKQCGAWNTIYKDGSGDSLIIPQKIIIDLECRTA